MEQMPFEKGRELERQIEKFFLIHGYQTKKNVHLEGKSGGKHEIDILAEKSDGIQTIKTMVECKAWNKPIEKDVVSKVSYIVRDLGLNKAIIVSLEGWRIGAEKAGKELGIELWGKDDIEKKLGKVFIAELETMEFKKVITGFPIAFLPDVVNPIVEKESKGFLSFGKEEIRFIKFCWLPCYLFEISCSKTEGFLSKKLKTQKIWNIYEALSGSLFLRFADMPNLEDVNAETILQPKIKYGKIKNKLLENFEKCTNVITPKAKERYKEKIIELGIPITTENLNVDNILEMFYPVYTARLSKGDKERLIVIDGRKGSIAKDISGVFTANMSYVLKSLESDK